MPIPPIPRTSDHSEVRLVRGCVVEFEQHGKPILAAVLEERKGRWALVTEHREELALGADRLALIPGSSVAANLDRNGQADALRTLSRLSDDYAKEIPLDEIWEALREEAGEYQPLEIARMIFDEPAPVQIIAVRRLLLRDKLYFKRSKNGFQPKSPDAVEESQQLLLAEQGKEQAKRELVDAIVARLGGQDVALPIEIYVLEDLAALGASAEQGKIALEVLDEVEARSGKKFEGKQEERAFKLLEKIGHFGPDEDLNLYRVGRTKKFSEQLLDASLQRKDEYLEILRREARERVSAFSITIDSAETQDIDDALSLEQNPDGWTLGVHISDVSVVVQPESELDRNSFRRATSIYTPDYTIPMLPRALSEGCTSLIAGEDRAVMSFYADIAVDGTVRRRWIVPSIISVGKRLSYNEVDAVLYDENSVSPLSDMLHALWKIAGLLEAQRLERGAIQFNRRELTPVVREGKIMLEESGEELPARRLVSELMIFANESAALYGRERNLALLYRGQEPPDLSIPPASLNVPEGPAREYFLRGMMKRSVVSLSPLRHSGLGVDAYIQGTSPIRRYGDLINQRQILASLREQELPYTVESLQAVQEELEQYLDEANYIQRMRNRYYLQRYIQQEGWREIPGVIVRAEAGRALIELEPTQSIHPFYMNADSAVGKRTYVVVEKNAPRREQLVLREISS